MNYSHAQRINLKVLQPYHQHNENLFNKLREAHDYAPKVSQQIAYQALLVEKKSFEVLFRKLTAFILKKEYEPLSMMEYSVFEGAISFYKKSIEETKVDLAARMITADVIEAYVDSQKETVALADKVFKTIIKSA